ncbi:MAG: hypothetical protein JWP10_1713 [Nocardioidaceae bacterium]|nr:hypothetical protein [Nocardioidaceae bacterium]
MTAIQLVRQAEASLDAALACEEPLAGVEIAELMRRTHAAIATGQALLLKMTVAADRANVAKREGAASTSAFIAKTTGISLKDAAREVKLAQDLQEVAPQTRDALTRPGMSKDKMAVLTGAMRKVPKSFDADQRQTIEDDLVAKGLKHSLEDFRRAARRAVEVLDPQLADEIEGKELFDEEKAARRDATFWMDGADDKGLVKGGFQIPVTAAAILKNMLESLTSPKQDQYLTDPREIGPHVDYTHKLGRAFCQILERYPAESKLPVHGGMPATLVIRVDYDQLVTGIGAATVCSTGDRISIKEVRRVGCEAKILPQVFNSKTAELDQGRARRLHDEKQRTAATAKYGGCAFPDCQTPPAWCKLHHQEFWAHGGKTTFKNGIPLCGHHHDLIHDEEWQARIAFDGWAEFIPPSFVDPERKPVRSTRWNPKNASL